MVRLQCQIKLSEMVGFTDAWAAVAHRKDGEPVAHKLEPLLRHVYADVLTTPATLSTFKDSLVALLEYLTCSTIFMTCLV
jgi:hypothetical protein